jgi:hypothetical protein
MKLGKITEKLDDYFSRLEGGKAKKIKPSHVEKVIAKLHTKQRLLNEELLDAENPSKRDRLESKLTTARKQIERAEWLLAKVSS